MDVELGGILNGAPIWVHWFVWAAIVAFCAGFIIRFLTPIGRAAGKILYEFSPQNRAGIKSQVDLAVLQNAEQMKKFDALDGRLTRELEERDKKWDGVAKKVDDLQTQFREFADKAA